MYVRQAEAQWAGVLLIRLFFYCSGDLKIAKRGVQAYGQKVKDEEFCQASKR